MQIAPSVSVVKVVNQDPLKSQGAIETHGAIEIVHELNKEKELFQKSSSLSNVTAASVVQSTKLLVKTPIRNARQASFIVDGTYVHAGTSLEVKVKLKKREKSEKVQHEYHILFRLYNKNNRFFIRPYEVLKGWEGDISSVYNEEMSNYCCIIMEKGAESLTDYLAREQQHISRIHSLTIVEKLVDILIAAHEENIVLMDFKPCNIIRCADDRWKAIDFDDSKEAGEAVNGRCTACYASFEMAKYSLDKNPSCKSLPASTAMDICSLGWMVWKIMNHNKSFCEGKSDKEILQILSTMTDEDMKKNINFVFPFKKDAPLRHWLEDALKIDPRTRPAANTLMTNYSILGSKEGTINTDSIVREIKDQLDIQHLSLLERIDTLSQDLLDQLGHLKASLDQEVVHLALNSQIVQFSNLMQTLEEQKLNAQSNNLQVDRLIVQLREAGADIKESVITSIIQVLSSKNDQNASQSDKLESVMQMMHGVKQQMNEIASLNQQQLSLLGKLGMKNNFMPHLFCIVAEEKREKLDENAKISSKVLNCVKRKAESFQGWFWESSRLIFICPVTLEMVPCGPHGKGYEICIPHEWVRTAVPILKVGWLLLKVALATQGLGTVIPNIFDFLPKTFNNDTVDALFDNIATPEQEEVSSAIDLMEDTPALVYLFKLIARAEGCDLESNAAVLTSWKPSKTGLHLTSCEKTGQSAWVSPAGRVASEKGNESFKKTVAPAEGV